MDYRAEYIRDWCEGIRDERLTGANTATRVGTALLMLLDFAESGLSSVIDTIDGLDTGGYWETVVNAKNGKKYAHLKTEFAGAYTDGDLSALGLSTSDDEGDEGGGEGTLLLSEPLASINSAGLGNPSQPGVGLVWDGTQWTYGKTSGLDLEALAQYLSSGGYATQAWVRNQNFLTEDSLDGYTWWGQSLNRGVVSGSLTDVTDITMSGKITIGGFVIEYDATKKALKFNGDIYATQGVSALGKSSDGEDGSTLTLAEPLTSINNAGLGTPSQSGVSLVWDGTQWTYGKTSGLDIEALAQYLSSGGYATQAWVRNQHYLTEDSLDGYTWWGQSLNRGVVSGSLTDVADITMSGKITIGGFVIEYDATKKALKFNGDIYATQGVSALGKSSDGEDGSTLTLAEPLASINNAGLGTPSQSGIGLVWDGTQWTYGKTSGLDIEALAQYLSSGGYATQAWVQGQGYLTSHQSLSGYATQAWVRNQGYLTSHQSLSGYATQAWVNDQGFLKSGDSARLRAIEFSAVPSTANDGGYIDFHYNGSSADYTSRIIENLAAGQLIVNNAAAFYLNAVSGGDILSPVSAFSSRQFRSRFTNSMLADTICLSGSLVMRNAQGIYMQDTSGTERIVLRVDTGNNLVLGEHFQNYEVYVRGNSLHVQTGASNVESLRVDANGNILQTRNNTSYILRNTSGGNVTVMRMDVNNVFEMGYGTVNGNYATHLYGGSTKGINFYAGTSLVARIYNDGSRNGIRIGDALLSWDAANKALKVQRYDGGAVDFYALGGISSLGLSDGSGSTDSATIDTINTHTLKLSDDCKITRDEDEIQLIASDGLRLKDYSGNTLFSVDSDGWGFSSAWVVGGRTYDAELYLYYNGRRYILDLQKCQQAGLLTVA